MILIRATLQIKALPITGNGQQLNSVEGIPAVDGRLGHCGLWVSSSSGNLGFQEEALHPQGSSLALGFPISPE